MSCRSFLQKKEGIFLTDAEIKKENTVCFSGHRTEKLPDGGKSSSPVIRVIQSMLYKQILDSINDGYKYFMTGTARGIDLWAGQMVIDLKTEHPDIGLIAVLPFKEQGAAFKCIDKWDFGNIIAKADKVICLNDVYTTSCMKVRNSYMVDHSGRLIAVVSNYASGTGQTISLARKAGLDLHIIDAGKINNAVKNIKTV